MVHNKRKKVTKQRGSKTHGWGAMKKHRGAGHRGGRGRAGSGKKADQKKPSYQHEGKMYLGNIGFTSLKKIKTKIRPINLGDLNRKIEMLVSEKKAKKTGDSYEINLNEMNYQKILSKGNIDKKMIISVDYASVSAKEKIESAGGELKLLKQKKEKKAKTEKKSKPEDEE